MTSDAKAYPFVQAVLEALAEHLPAGGELELAGPPRLWRVVPRDRPPIPLTRDGAEGGGPLYLPVGGVGTWIPFLPRRLNTRLSAVDVVESIQDLVHNLGWPDWPFEDAAVKASVNRLNIQVWFESPDGRRHWDLPPFPAHLLR